MSLRRRIAAAAALSVAAVVTGLGLVGYLSAHSRLVGQIQRELRARAAPYLLPHANGLGATGGFRGIPGPSLSRGGSATGQAGGGGGRQPTGHRDEIPPAPPFGAAPGYFQFVRPDGSTSAGSGGSAELPVSQGTLVIARRARGSFFSTARVRGIHLEVLTIGDPYDHYAVQVALPLSGVDSVLHGMLVTYGVLVAAGVLLAILLGAAISRSALAPIERFVGHTERVTSSLDRPRRLEETGAKELRRLAASFNQTLDALERSIEAQRHLVADASHELRTPMAALRSNIQIFLDAERLPVEEREALQEAILAEVDELTQVVADVVELARGSAPSAHLEAIELDTLVREATERARRRAPQLRFNLELAPTVIVNAPDRVGRAVTNLIDNARKWSPADGEIDVSLDDGRLVVRDHGPGFDERDLPYVFDRFYRAENARRLPGSGLGLAIVKQAAEAYGGGAQAANAPDGGAIVAVSFGSPDPQGAEASRPIQTETRTPSSSGISTDA